MLRLFARHNCALSVSRPQSLSLASIGFGKPSTHRFLSTSTTKSSQINADVKNPALFDVSHVTAIVTGGGTGIGLMITQALAANGARVYITGRRPDALSRVVDLYSPHPGAIIALPGDISQKSEVTRLAAELSKREPSGIQLLVNNAGIARDDNTRFSSSHRAPNSHDAQAISEHFLRSEPTQWEATFRTNVTAGYFMSMAFLPLLARGQDVPALQREGYTSSVVNVSSISGALKSSSGGQFSYAASKAAFTHLTRMLATTFAGTKVRVNAIAPGMFPSEMTSPSRSSDDDGKTRDLDMTSSNPAGRKGKDRDMAATILFLAGKGGAFYNQQVLFPDGGGLSVSPAQQ